MIDRAKVDAADADLQFTRMLQKILNLERTIDPKVFNADHQCTPIPEIRGITANPEATVEEKVLDGKYRLTETPEIREVKVNLEATVG